MEQPREAVAELQAPQAARRQLSGAVPDGPRAGDVQNLLAQAYRLADHLVRD